VAGHHDKWLLTDHLLIKSTPSTVIIADLPFRGKLLQRHTTNIEIIMILIGNDKTVTLLFQLPGAKKIVLQVRLELQSYNN
jgi:hypothetical protein